MQKKEYKLELAGKSITAEFNDLANQTNGSVIVSMGNTRVLATVVMSKKDREGIDFFPLVVDYEEKFYAAGKILGGQFIRREGRPSDEAILTGRVVDRTIRPLFNQKMRKEVQVVLTALAVDDDNDTDIPAILGASLALAVSDIPWDGPVGATRVCGYADATLELNPDHAKRETSAFDMVICGKAETINMIEAEAKEIPETVAVSALNLALEAISKLEAWQKQIVSEIGKKKVSFTFPETPTELTALFNSEIKSKMPLAIFSGAGHEGIHGIQDEWMSLVAEKFPEGNHKTFASHLFEDTINDLVHEEAIANNKRPDGRKMDEVRELYAQAGGVSPLLHGTGIFYRGGTHVLTALTLGGPKDSQILDGMEVEGKKYFMHHYNFPPFSSGETGRMGGINRRATGHGALAEKALKATLPSRDVFPYTIRLVSESMASNGSTSQASICASTLALMDGGVPITRPTAGIAMGLMSYPDGRYKVLTDIQGPEDHHGDMDFKVAGTTVGVTAIQMDVKVGGISVKVLSEALEQGKQARLQIIRTIETAIPAPRADLAPNAPRIAIVKINPEKIGALIGPGGKVIQGITASTGADINVEQDGSVFILGKKEQVELAKKLVDGITHEYKAGEKFEGPIVRIMDFGFFVELSPNQDGMVHVSEMASFRVNNIRDYVKEGDRVPVVVKEIDEKGRVNLSIKRANPNFFTEKKSA
ncbi:MAG: polyribonucleotide nucleotidyltransferase [Candidatus Paceibacterota bacterium]|jgi:polyribonucleotide nucleotidyltransferase